MWGKYRFGSLEVLWTDIDPFCSALEILREILGHEPLFCFLHRRLHEETQNFSGGLGGFSSKLWVWHGIPNSYLEASSDDVENVWST